MLSHDFARELLKRRNHDLRFVVDVSVPGHDDEPETCTVQMEDDRHRATGAAGDPPEVLTYDGEDDLLDVRLGQVFLGRQGDYTLSGDEVLLVLKAINTQMHRISHIGMDREGLKRFTDLYEKIKKERG